MNETATDLVWQRYQNWTATHPSWPESTLESFVHCPVCNDVHPSKGLKYPIILDGEPTKICQGCAKKLGLIATELIE